MLVTIGNIFIKQIIQNANPQIGIFCKILNLVRHGKDEEMKEKLSRIKQINTRKK